MSPTANPGSAIAADGDFTDTEEQQDGLRMGFLDHLDEFRRRILYALYVFLACCALSFYYWQDLYLYYVTYFGSLGGQLIFSAPMGGFMFSMKISALAGLVIAAPFIFSQLWLFVAPGLYAREKRVVVPFVMFSSVLFFAGAYFAHAVAFPSMQRFFASFEMGLVKFMPTLDDVFAFYVKVVLGMGIVFQMPLLVFFLARFGMVTARLLIKNFKYALLAIIVLAAIITPSGDPVNLAVFAAPMLVLYIISIGVAAVFAKKRPKDA